MTMPGFAPVRLAHIAHLRVIDGHLCGIAAPAVPGGEHGRLAHILLARLAPLRDEDRMRSREYSSYGTRDRGCLPASCELIVLPVVAAHQDEEPTGGAEAHRGCRPGCPALLAARRTDIALADELLADLGEITLVSARLSSSNTVSR